MKVDRPSQTICTRCNGRRTVQVSCPDPITVDTSTISQAGPSPLTISCAVLHLGPCPQCNATGTIPTTPGRWSAMIRSSL